MKIAVGKATIGSIRGLPPIRRTLFHRAIVRMSFDTILAARPTIEGQGPLRESTSSHYEITKFDCFLWSPQKRRPVTGPQHSASAGPTTPGLLRVLCQNENSFRQKGQIPSADVWYVPTMPRFKRLRKLSSSTPQH